MYATKRRRRNIKTNVKCQAKDPPKSNPSKRHRERLNSELEQLASLLPFDQTVVSKLDKLSILRLAVSYLRTKSYFQAALLERRSLDNQLHHRLHQRIHHNQHLYNNFDFGFTDQDFVLQALNGFLLVVTGDGELFYVSETVEQYLGFHQSDIVHQSALELIHSEDRELFKNQLSWAHQLQQQLQQQQQSQQQQQQQASTESTDLNMPLDKILLPGNEHFLQRCFTLRFRCLLDNASGFITMEISGKIGRVLGQNFKSSFSGNSSSGEAPQLALFALCCPFGPLPLSDISGKDCTFKSRHKMDMSVLSMDNKGQVLFNYTNEEFLTKNSYDLVHPDDLQYFASAHLELIKTGSSGLVAYRLMSKDFRWVWLQTSSKVTYRNSKPDSILCIHRQLTEDEGDDLFRKRGTEFKLPYPISDCEPEPNSYDACVDGEKVQVDSTTRKGRNSPRRSDTSEDHVGASRKKKRKQQPPPPYCNIIKKENHIYSTPTSSLPVMNHPLGGLNRNALGKQPAITAEEYCKTNGGGSYSELFPQSFCGGVAPTTPNAFYDRLQGGYGLEYPCLVDPSRYSYTDLLSHAQYRKYLHYATAGDSATTFQAFGCPEGAASLLSGRLSHGTVGFDTAMVSSERPLIYVDSYPQYPEKNRQHESMWSVNNLEGRKVPAESPPTISAVCPTSYPCGSSASSFTSRSPSGESVSNSDALPYPSCGETVRLNSTGSTMSNAATTSIDAYASLKRPTMLLAASDVKVNNNIVRERTSVIQQNVQNRQNFKVEKDAQRSLGGIAIPVVKTSMGYNNDTTSSPTSVCNIVIPNCHAIRQMPPQSHDSYNLYSHYPSEPTHSFTDVFDLLSARSMFDPQKVACYGESW